MRGSLPERAVTDYAILIDAETWSFIERTYSYYPQGYDGASIAEQRAVYDEMCRAFHAGYPENVTAETTAIEAPGRAFPIRVYRRDRPKRSAMVLYFHGGSFMFGGLDSHDDVCAELCNGTGYEVVSVDYRLAPEHLHPAATDDALAAFEWALRAYDRPVLLCGDSAGGNLAATVAHATRGHAQRPAGQLLIYPALGGDMSAGSYVTHAAAPMLSVRELRQSIAIRSGGIDRTGEVSFAPLADGDFANLPPTVIVTAECDPLSSDGEAYRDRIVAAGGQAVWREEPGLVHGYLRARHSVGRARRSFAWIVQTLKSLGE